MAIRQLILLTRFIALAAAATCELPHMNPMQHQYHERHIRHILDPVADSAILLARQASNTSVLAFAARLLRVHDQFESTCHDHHWEESLTHKLCASFIRHNQSIGAHCHKSDTLKSQNRPWGYACTCAGLHKILHDCRHHVLPWARDSSTCDHITVNDCSHAHPFGGLCSYRHKLLERHLHRRQRQRWRSTHSQHNTQPKHRAWTQHSSAQKSAETAQGIMDRIRRKAGTRATFTRPNNK